MKKSPLVEFAGKMFFLFLLTIFGCSLALAQATTGNVKGRVVDPNGQVVPGATVTAKNDATGVTSPTTVTNDDGLYVIANLIPGTYSVTVSNKAGFKTEMRSNVAVRLGLDIEVNFELQIGTATETVTVVAGREEVASTNSEIASNFESRKVNDLPSNAAGSGIDTLALNVPGVTPGFGNVNSNGTTLSVNGNRARSNNFSIDGTDNNDLSIGGPSYFVSNEEIVEEFQIVTNNFSAQYGRNQGAIINIVTKSGTNNFRGSVFGYHRNASLLDAMTNLERRTPTRSKRDKFINNVFGWTLGGPIVKNKAFFFGSFQGIRSRQTALGQATQLAILPSEFSRLSAAFPGNNAIQAIVRQSAFALTNFGTVRARTDRAINSDRVCISLTPATNCVTTAGGNTSGFFAAAFPEREFPLNFDQDEITVRGDWNITSKDNLSVRYLWQDNATINSLGGSNGFTGDQPANSKNFSGFYNRQLSSTIVNNFQGTFQRLSVVFGGGCTDPLTGCIPDPATKIGEAYTNIAFGGVSGNITNSTLQTIGGATNLPQGRIVDVYQFSDKVSWIRGTHNFTFGADVRYLKNSVPFLPNINGVFRYNSVTALINNTPSNITLADGEPQLSYKEWDQFYFFQDDWKVRPNFTLNLGIRYEYTGQPINLINKITTERESDNTKALYRQNLPLEARIFPKIPSDKNNWAPRLGFAWSPSFGDNAFSRFLFGEKEESVVRGGFSVAYDAVFYNIMLNISTSAPVVILDTFTNTVPLPANPIGSAVRSAASSSLRRNTFDPRLLSQTIVSSDFHSPYTMQYSLGLQRQINSSNVFEIRYVGNKGKDLFQTVNRNPRYDNIWNGFTAGGVTFPSFRSLLPSDTPAPQVCVDNTSTPDNEGACNGRLRAGFGQIRSRENTGSSQYDSLQLRYNGRFLNKSFSFGASYTFSKALDNASEIFAFGENALAQNPFDIQDGERALSGFDRRHAFSLNFIYDIPLYKSQNSFVGKLLGGWQINSNYVVGSGRPYTPEQSFISGRAGFNGGYQDSAFTSGFIGFDNFRPFNGNTSADVRTVGIHVVDARLAGFSQVTAPTGFVSLTELNRGRVVTVTPNDVRFIFNGPGAATYFGTPFGTAARNSIRGPILNQMNLGIFKTTNITEKVKIQFRAEAFNVLNEPNAGFGVAAGASLPILTVETLGFGDKGEVGLSSRRVQLGLRIQF